MRPWHLVLLTAGLVLLAGCGTNSGNAAIAQQLVGTWQQTSVSTDGTNFTTKTGPTLTFGTDSTFSDGAAGDFGVWTYTAANQVLTLTYGSGPLAGTTVQYGLSFPVTGAMTLVTYTASLTPTTNVSKWSKS